MKDPASGPALSDRDLIGKTLDGEADCLVNLTQRYYRLVFSYAQFLTDDILLAEDLTQETFLRAYNSLAKIKNRDAFASWLFSITKNTYLGYAKERTRVKKVIKELVYLKTKDEKPFMPQAKEQTASETRKKHLKKAIADLPDNYRTVLMMKHQSRLSCKEIAIILNKPIGTITSELSRSYEIIRHKIMVINGGLNNGL